MTRKQQLFVLSVSIFLLFSPFIVRSAEVSWTNYVLNIQGKIEAGDLDKINKSIIEKGTVPIATTIDSMGGDVIEAMKIGATLRELALRTTVNEHCASACFFILVGSPDRVVSGKVGIHRPYFEKEYFAGLTVTDARIKYDELTVRATEYLASMGVPNSVVHEMFSVSSGDERWLINTEFYDRVGAKAPFYEELALAKCGPDLSDDDLRIMFSNEYRGTVAQRALIEFDLKRTECVWNINSSERRGYIDRIKQKYSTW